MLYKFTDIDGDAVYIVDRVITAIKPSKNRPRTIKGAMGEIITDSDIYKFNLTPDEIVQEIKRQDAESWKTYNPEPPADITTEDVAKKLFGDNIPELFQRAINAEKELRAERQTPNMPPPLN